MLLLWKEEVMKVLEAGKLYERTDISGKKLSGAILRNYPIPTFFEAVPELL
jgi:hypothetical protein